MSLKQAPRRERTVLYGVRLRKLDLFELLAIFEQLDSRLVTIEIDDYTLDSPEDIDQLPPTVTTAKRISISSSFGSTYDDSFSVELNRSMCIVSVMSTDARALGVYIQACNLLRKCRIPAWWVRVGANKVIPPAIALLAMLWALIVFVPDVSAFIVSLCAAAVYGWVQLIYPDRHYVLDLREHPPFWERHKELRDKTITAAIGAAVGAVIGAVLNHLLRKC